MFESHNSLRFIVIISCIEIEAIVGISFAYIMTEIIRI